MKEYSELRASNLELDNKYKLLEAEKHRWEKDFNEKHGSLIKEIEALKVDKTNIDGVLTVKLEQLKNTDAELVIAKDTIKEKEREIAGYKALLETGREEIQKYIEDRKSLEREYNSTVESKKTTQVEIDRVIVLNERLAKANKESMDKERERSIENSTLLKQVAELNNELDMIRRDLEQKQRELDIVRDAKKVTQKDLDKSGTTVSKLQEELQRFNGMNKEYEDDRVNISKRLTETIEILGAKEDELKALHMRLNVADERILDLEAANSRLSQEYESIKISLSKYDEEISYTRQGREGEGVRVYEIAQEKERIERELMSKDLELKNLRAEMEEIRITREMWMEERYKFNEEFETLKEHVKVLQAQNDSVRI